MGRRADVSDRRHIDPGILDDERSRNTKSPR
jgi:hypothetical protein